MLQVRLADGWLKDKHSLHLLERLKKNGVALRKAILEVFVKLADLAALDGLDLDEQSLNALQPFLEKLVHFAVGLLKAIDVEDQTVVGIEAADIIRTASGAFLLDVVIHLLDDDACLHADLL